MIKSQYIAHRIFKRNGLIKKYINHSALSHLSEEEMDFLKFQKKNPWKFSFSIIPEKPAPDFFRMKDVFTGDSYLLYSPPMSQIMLSKDVRRELREASKNENAKGVQFLLTQINELKVLS